MAKILEARPPKVINDHLESLEKVQNTVDELQNQIDQTKQAISESFSDCVVVFVDLVDSTAFKLANTESVWILRVKLFVDVISEYATELGGNVVKVIGDEVMITFTRDEQNNDALNFVMRTNEIEDVLRRITGHATKIKIALDGGKVCFIKYTGNEAPDPQGTPVDRCARISKFCRPSTVLTSEAQYLRFEHKDIWKFVGKPNLKGIGNTSVYQLGAETVIAEDTKTISMREFNRLNTFDEENKVLSDKNRKLQDQIRELGKKPNPDATVPDGEDKAWKEIEDVIKEINKLIDGAPSSRHQYARFLFLSEIGEYEKYDPFNGKVFDDLIQAGIVDSKEDNGWYCINPNHKRNQKVQTKIADLEQLLLSFLEVYGDINEDEMFEHSVKDPEFWDEYIGYQVI